VRVVGGSKSPFQSKKDFLFSFLMLYTSKIGGVFNGLSSSKNVLYIVKQLSIIYSLFELII
jgi:hypothetical protein